MPPSALALLARLVRAGHLVVVGHRDRAQARRLRRLEQGVHRRGAVVGVVGVHVQVDVDEVAALEALAHRGLALHRMAARGDLAVEGLELVGGAGPLELGVRGRDPPAQPLRQRLVAQQALELSGQGHRVARLEQQPQLALVEHLLVLGEPRGHRHRAAGERPEQQLRGGRRARRGGHGDGGARQVLGLRAVGGPGEADALAQPPRQRGRREGRRGRAARWSRSSRARRGACAGRAGTAAARRAPPRRENTISGVPSRESGHACVSAPGLITR